MSQTAKKETVFFVIEKSRRDHRASPAKEAGARRIFSIPPVASEAFRRRLSGPVW